MTCRIGFDIGGTFTDLFLVDDETGDIHQAKVPTTPHDFSEGALTGIIAILDEHDIDPDEISYLSHASTVATNAVLERAGSETGLITTKGFRDIVAFGREKREQIYNVSAPQNPTFVDRKNRIGVTERISPEGDLIEPLREAEIESAVDALVDNDVESVAVSLLHSYRNPEHEQRIREIVTDRSDMRVSLSSDVMPEIQEYERTITTVINAYVSAKVHDYIERLVAGLEELGIDAPLYVMQSNGGVTTPQHLEGRSMRLISSGPAGGVRGAKLLAETSDIQNIITLDLGGTSADACVVHDGVIETTTEGSIETTRNGDKARLPLMFEQIDVRSVGTGGGSIAWTDPSGVLKVGPKSSGANPGPACYGRGGTEPTVTDAALLLNYLNEETLLGGEMRLDKAAAERAFEELSQEVGTNVLDLADGVLEIATTSMMQAIRQVTVEKGYDPRDFALVCFGGAGPMFSTRLAKNLEIERVLIPITPGVLSANGLVASDKRYDFSRSRPLILSPDNAPEIAEIFRNFEDEAAEVIETDPNISRSVDLRYQGQAFTTSVPLPDGEIDGAMIAEIEERFTDKFESIYQFSDPDKQIEGVTWRLQAVEPTASLAIHPDRSEGSAEEAIKSRRDVYHDGNYEEYTVYNRTKLAAGVTFSGPAIIEESESTTVIEDDSDVHIDEVGNIIIDL